MALDTILDVIRPVSHSLRRFRDDRVLADELRSFLCQSLADFPWQLEVSDWTETHYTVGRGEEHWFGSPLRVRFKTPAPARDLLRLDGLSVLEHFVRGELDLEDNLFLLASIQNFAKLGMSPLRFASRVIVDKAFQDPRRATTSVKSHYDIPQQVLDTYLDRVYKAYSCAMFENPDRMDLQESLRVGEGKSDDFDSLEKAQWRKFKDAVDFIAPSNGDRMIDIGCGYGGQLVVALEEYPDTNVVGWTLSRNQVLEGRKMLARFPVDRWELREGDYRSDGSVYDHVMSTGMISHVGPRGLVPYVKRVRSMIRDGGRYVHHALMTPYSVLPLNFHIGTTFAKKYVWPGFHWFTVGEHVRALERNGFEVTRLTNLSPHYVKTAFAWYNRMVQHRKVMIRDLGEQTYRAWQIYLAGSAGNMHHNRGIHVYRIYCQAV